jgi:hypothetical protein
LGSPITQRRLLTLFENHGQTLGCWVVTPDHAVGWKQAPVFEPIHYANHDDAVASSGKEFMSGCTDCWASGVLEIHRSLFISRGIPIESINPRQFVHGPVEHQPPAEIEFRGTDTGRFEVGETRLYF